jgi:hypothetical protein
MYNNDHERKQRAACVCLIIYIMFQKSSKGFCSFLKHFGGNPDPN